MNIVTKEEFNLHKEYEVFDIIYSIPKDTNKNESQEWVVIGHVLNSSSDKRCFETQLSSHPISKHIQQNSKITLEDVRHNSYIGGNLETLIAEKKKMIIKYYTDLIKEL